MSKSFPLPRPMLTLLLMTTKNVDEMDVEVVWILEWVSRWNVI